MQSPGRPARQGTKQEETRVHSSLAQLGADLQAYFFFKKKERNEIEKTFLGKQEREREIDHKMVQHQPHSSGSGTPADGSPLPVQESRTQHVRL